jgi:hypothetical protein
MTTQPIKTYVALNLIPHVNIGRCSEVLSNQSQCWKAGDFQITVTTPSEGEETEPTIVTYQKCRRHAQAEKDTDGSVAEILKAEPESTPVAEVKPTTKAPVSATK